MDHKPSNGKTTTTTSTNPSNKNHKGSSKKKKPIKVVYISNPVMVKASAAEFRGLVQELTGRDADPSKYTDMDGGTGFESSNQEILQAAPLASPQLLRSGACNSSEACADYLCNGHVDKSTHRGDHDNDDFDENEDFMSPWINNYSMFSPPAMFDDFPHKY